MFLNRCRLVEPFYSIYVAQYQYEYRQKKRNSGAGYFFFKPQFGLEFQNTRNENPETLGIEFQNTRKTAHFRIIWMSTLLGSLPLFVLAPWKLPLSSKKDGNYRFISIGVFLFDLYCIGLFFFLQKMVKHDSADDIQDKEEVEDNGSDIIAVCLQLLLLFQTEKIEKVGSTGGDHIAEGNDCSQSNDQRNP